MTNEYLGKDEYIKEVNKPQVPLQDVINKNRKYWDKVLDDINIYGENNHNDSIRFAKVLPKDLYRKVCANLGIPILHDTDDITAKTPEPKPRRIIKQPMLSFRKTLHIERDADSDTDVEISQSDEEEKPDIHQEFLSKPVREMVTWKSKYLAPEREDEKNLVKKADDLTDKIAQDFCKYMMELGGAQKSQLFTPKAIKELFQIEFDTHVSHSLKVVPKELPTVGCVVANDTGNPHKSQAAALERELSKDIEIEKLPDNIRGFDRFLTRGDQWKAPRNDTVNQWRSSRRVPKELVSLKTVWEGITNLRSVRDYCRWMIDHPEYRRAPYLSSLGMFDPVVLAARSCAGDTSPQHAVGAPGPRTIDNLRRRLSRLADKCGID